MDTCYRLSGVNAIYNPLSPGKIHITPEIISKWMVVSVTFAHNHYTKDLRLNYISLAAS